MSPDDQTEALVDNVRDLQPANLLETRSQEVRRDLLVTVLNQAYVVYLGGFGGWGSSPTARDPIDQVIVCALRLITIANEAANAKPLAEVTIGSIDREAEDALALLFRFARWDRLDLNGERGLEESEPLDGLQGRLVRRARDLGASWRKIGDALHMSAQGIQQKARDRGWMSGSSSAGPDE